MAESNGLRQDAVAEILGEVVFVLVGIPLFAWIEAHLDDGVHDVFRYDVRRGTAPVAEETVAVRFDAV